MLNVVYILLTAACWLALQRSIDLGNFLFGVLLGIGIMKVMGFAPIRERGPGRTVRYVVATLKVIFWFGLEILYANYEQLKIVLAPRVNVKPMWIRYASELESPRLRAILGMMISMTPGTITCRAEYSDRVLVIHALSADDEQATIDRIRRILEAPLRGIEQL